MGWAARTHHSGEMKPVSPAVAQRARLERLARGIKSEDDLRRVLRDVEDPVMRDAVERLLRPMVQGKLVASVIDAK